ncbi:MAG: 4Fe-4S binding protein [Verrucomicrobia bacterium]|nr:4Fe-4S binding protein [Verrucomicrobiota bacterium]
MAKRGLRAKASVLVRWRFAVQTAFLGVWLLPLRVFAVCSPVFHCYACPLATFACPIGVLAQMSALHVVPLIAIGTLFVVGGLFGAFICGWVCPFGWLQDLTAKLPIRKLTLPRWATYFRYIVLIGLVLLVPFFLGEKHPLFICRVCPAGALEGAMPQTVKTAIQTGKLSLPSPAKLAVLGAFLVTIFFIYRPWCTLFCPLGAIFGLFNRISAFFLRFKPSLCLDCSICHKICHYNVKPDERANDPRCTRCLDCTRCRALTFTNVLQRSAEAVEPENEA